MAGIKGKSGGARKGAGRKPKNPNEYRKTYPITFAPSFMEKLDRKRKNLSRGEYIEKHLKM